MLVELGRAARAGAKIKTRQPLTRALVAAPGFAELSDELRAEIADELNVGELIALTGDLVERTVKPNFRSLGARFGKGTPAVARAIGAANPTTLTAALRADGTATVDVDGAAVDIGADDVIVTETPLEGWAVATEAGETVALDLEITPELRRAGVARDVVRLIQEARKSADLEVTDRIELWWEATLSETGEAMREQAEWIAGEVLAVAQNEGRPAADLVPHETADLGLTFWLRQAGG